MNDAIDMFAGLGGFTEGASRAGLKVVWAANHWREAVDCHAANHPTVHHECQDLHQANWMQVPAHNWLLASPACQGHAKARGVERPHHDAFRSTAWAVISCAEVHRPAFAIIENVPEFLKWSLYPAWESAWKALGYTPSPHVFDTADVGVPQNRLRVLIICTQSKAPIKLTPPAMKHMPSSGVIDWSGGRWSKVHKPGRAAATIERFEHGRRTFGKRFIFSYYGNTKTARSINRPFGTITTRDRWGIVDGDRMRMALVDECRAAMGFPAHYQLPVNGRTAVHMLGNAVPPDLAAYVINEVRRVA